MDLGQDTGLSKGTIYSGVGHLGLILWVAVGDWLFPHSEPEVIEVMSVSTMTSAEFDAMQSTSPAPSETPAPEQPQAPAAEETPPPPAPEPEPQPEPQPDPQPQPEPVAETPPPPAEDVPDMVEAQPVPDPAPDDVAVAPEEQPIPTMTSSMRPKPKPADIVAPNPVEVPEEAVTADTPTQATTDQPTEQPPEVIEEPQQETAPQETGDVLRTEATEEQDQPLGMATSPRPKSKPDRPRVTEEPAAETATVSAEEASADAGGASSNAPAGPPLNAGEIGDVRAAIGGKWSLGAVSSDTLRTTIVVRVSFDPTGKPTSIDLIESDGPSQAATDTAFSAARSAIIRAAREGGIPFPPDKYETWKVVDFVFDPNGMRFR